MSNTFRKVAVAKAAAALVLFGVQFAAPAEAVDCYPPGSCTGGSTTEYQAVDVVETPPNTAAALQCTGSTCVPVEVRRTVSDTGVTLTIGTGVTVQIVPVASGGTRLQVSSDGTLVIPSGGGVTITLSGLTPGTWADVYLNSDRIFLGRARVGSDGKVNATFPLPASVPVGQHTAQVISTDFAGRVVTAALGIVVKGTVPATASRFVINNATPAAAGKVAPGSRVQLRAGLFSVGNGTRAGYAATSKLGRCTTKVVVKTSSGKTLLPSTCMSYAKADGKAAYTWRVPTTYKGKARAVFTFKETGRAAVTYSRAFSIG